MATLDTVVYTTARTTFTIDRRAFSTDQIIVYYSDNTTSPAPADVLTGATVVTGDVTIDGLDARQNAFTVNYPDAPSTGTIIVEIRGATDRITTFINGRFPSPSDLDSELDHFLTLLDGITGGNSTDNLQTLRDDIDTNTTNITTNTTNITAHDTRITDLETDALLEDAGDSKFNAESKVIKNLAQAVAGTDATNLAQVQSMVSDATGVGLPAGTNGQWLKLVAGAGVWTDLDSDEVAYDNGVSGLTATDVKAAIDEVADGVQSYYSSSTTGTTSITATNGNFNTEEILNPAAGTYLVVFGGTMSHSGADSAANITGEVIIQKNSVDQQVVDWKMRREDPEPDYPIAGTAIVNVNGADDLYLEVNVTANIGTHTVEILNPHMVAVRIGP